MAKTQAAPEAQPSPDPQHDIQPQESVSLDDAAPIEASAEPPAPEPARQLTPHAKAMEAIVEARRRELERQEAENQRAGLATQPPAIGHDPMAPQPEPEPPAAAPAAAQDAPNAPAATPVAPEPQPPAPAAPSAPAEAPRTYKITVQGREIELPEGDLIRAAELGVASEARFRQAQQTLDEARRVAAAAGQPLTGAGPSPPAATPPTPAPQPPQFDRDAALQLAEVILYEGDKEKVADAILRLTQTQQASPQINEERLAENVYGRVDQSLQLRRDLETFASEYKDIIDRPSLATLAGQAAQQLRAHYAQTGTPRTEMQIFREAGDWVRGEMQALASQFGAPQSPPPQTQPANPAAPAVALANPGARTVMKRSIPQAPAAAAAQASEPAPRQQTGTDVVNWMRRTRGQSVYT